jgi:succinate dehydrogenase/fumarate reductase flavoprotein subunit
MHKEIPSMEWPYPLAYGEENEVEADVLVLGGGLAGCFAAISAAQKGLKVALVDKGGVKRSGCAGSGVDHWMHSATNPACRISPEELAEALIRSRGGWSLGIGTYIECREGWDALVELEQMGMKIRDTDDTFKGAPFRDEKTKLLFAYDYDNRYTIRIWGTGMKPALYKACRRLGVAMYERVMATSLLTEAGEQGARVVGATGVDTRTGQFHIFKGKATVLAMARPGRLWTFSTELIGAPGSQFQPFINAGDGHAMAWKAGAEFSMMDANTKTGGGFNYPPYGVGNTRNTWYACTMVDANGKEVPWVDKDGRILETVEERYRTAPGQKVFLMGGGPHTGKIAQDLMQPIITFEKDEFTPPFYADLPSMPAQERRAIFGLMVGQEGKSNIPVYHTLAQAGFDPDKDMLQHYEGSFEGVGPPQWLSYNFSPAGLIVDWDLMTNLDGLFAAGEQQLAAGGCAHACATGRYAGRKAAEYALKAGEPVLERDQVDAEKERVYAPVKRNEGIDWKELEAGIARVMQDYCGPVKNDQLLDLGMKWLEEIKEQEAMQLSAGNPHELTRALEVLSILTLGEMAIHANIARKAKTGTLDIKGPGKRKENRHQEQKWITTKLVDGNVQINERPLNFWGDLKENYDFHCGL